MAGASPLCPLCVLRVLCGKKAGAGLLAFLAVKNKPSKNQAGVSLLAFLASFAVKKVCGHHAERHALHFKIADVNDESLRFVPYYEIEKEQITCFPFFTGN
jgi:hypothetical protein